MLVLRCHCVGDVFVRMCDAVPMDACVSRTRPKVDPIARANCSVGLIHFVCWNDRFKVLRALSLVLFEPFRRSFVSCVMEHKFSTSGCFFAGWLRYL